MFYFKLFSFRLVLTYTIHYFFFMYRMFIFALCTFTGEYFVYIRIYTVFFLYFCVQSIYVCTLPAYLNVLINEKVQMCIVRVEVHNFINKMLKL